MERIEYRDVKDKTAWPRGVWDTEPDKIQWQDEATSLPCLIVRGPHGSLCGYVGVAESHPLYRKEGDDLDVHGGITFGSLCAEGADEAKGICHKPGAGEPDHVWWFGFDTAHAGDFCPKFDTNLGAPTGWGENVAYRDIAYVEGECRSLAKQLAAMA
jgi:hypothetical protein